MRPLRLESYNPGWATEFKRIRAELLGILKNVRVLAIEHVGSTANPGMVAKPIIDIDIIVPSTDFPQAVAYLARNGYTYNPEPHFDRVSMRYDAHEVKGQEHDSGAFYPTPDGRMRRAVYVVMPCSQQLRDHLVIRKALAEHPELLQEYSRIKMEYYEQEFKDGGFATWEEYNGKKSGILQRIKRCTDIEEGARGYFGGGEESKDATGRFDIGPLLWGPVLKSERNRG